jgi:hypothetical protein
MRITSCAVPGAAAVLATCLLASTALADDKVGMPFENPDNPTEYTIASYSVIVKELNASKRSSTTEPTITVWGHTRISRRPWLG